MHIPIQISPDHPEPIYRQITTQLRELIVSGQLAPGSPLPSIRSLAQSLSCSVITTPVSIKNWSRRVCFTLVRDWEPSSPKSNQTSVKMSEGKPYTMPYAKQWKQGDGLTVHRRSYASFLSRY